MSKETQLPKQNELQIKRSPEEIEVRITQIQQLLKDHTHVQGSWANQFILIAKLHELNWLIGDDEHEVGDLLV